MKKIHLVILILVLLGATAYMTLSSANKPLEEEMVLTAPSTLPDFTLIDIKGQSNSIHALAGNKPTLFIYYNSTCHLCQDELAAISKRIEEFKDYNLIFTTVQPVGEMVGFVSDLGIDKNANVHFLLDADMKVASFYQIKSVPAIYCYNAEKKLVAEYVGKAEVDLLLKNLSQPN
jgi:peroxiredoxin